jgi:LmbE family N-acetylglucosaminyl deacetylase
VWCALTNQPNVTLDVTDTWEIRLRAVLEHKTQVQDVEKLIARLKSRRAEDSTDENPRYEDKFRVIRYG